jgi:hypothetical protein
MLLADRSQRELKLVKKKGHQGSKRGRDKIEGGGSPHTTLVLPDNENDSCITEQWEIMT